MAETAERAEVEAQIKKLSPGQGDVVVMRLGAFDLILDEKWLRDVATWVDARGALFIVLEEGQSLEVISESAMAHHGWYKHDANTPPQVSEDQGQII